MTVQELLLQDSEVIIPIGAAKLQQIILTLRDYKQKAENLTVKLDDSRMIAAYWELETKALKNELSTLRKTKMRCHSIDLDLKDLL